MTLIFHTRPVEIVYLFLQCMSYTIDTLPRPIAKRDQDEALDILLRCESIIEKAVEEYKIDTEEAGEYKKEVYKLFQNDPRLEVIHLIYKSLFSELFTN